MIKFALSALSLSDPSNKIWQKIKIYSYGLKGGSWWIIKIIIIINKN